MLSSGADVNMRSSSFLKKPPSTVDPIIWSSIAQSPSASIFLKKAQMNQARSNVVFSLFPEFDKLLNQQTIAFNAAESFKKQLGDAKNEISSIHQHFTPAEARLFRWP